MKNSTAAAIMFLVGLIGSLGGIAVMYFSEPTAETARIMNLFIITFALGAAFGLINMVVNRNE